MPLLSIVHNVYKKNPYIKQTCTHNLHSLASDHVDYKYIIFNDNGDKQIEADLEDIISLPRVEYIYSKINYGKKMCAGGWLGALPYIDSKYIQPLQTQDDVTLPLFYRACVDRMENIKDIMLCHTNFFHTDENLNITNEDLHPLAIGGLPSPLATFIQWFGIVDNKVTKINNHVAAPTVIYKMDVHEKVGLPDLDNFLGAADLEYWARMLFNDIKFHYIATPLVLYRHSKYSAGNEIIDGKPNRGYWQELCIQKIKEKYSKLWDEKYGNKTNIGKE